MKALTASVPAPALGVTDTDALRDDPRFPMVVFRNKEQALVVFRNKEQALVVFRNKEQALVVFRNKEQALVV